MLQTYPILLLLSLVSLCTSSVYYAPCAQNAGRNCPSSTNRTDFLLAMKKGGTNVLSTDTYLYDFFLCEEYNYDCGYMTSQDSFVNVANGVSLDINATQLADITTLPSTEAKILPYIGRHGDAVKCAMTIFPLMLTIAESKQVLDGFMQTLTTTTTTLYNKARNTTSTKLWPDININIRTAILQKLKSTPSLFLTLPSQLWSNIYTNNYGQISKYLKASYKQNNQMIDLHAAYLIDSVTSKCNKLQSINFLVDQSGSIGAPGFQLALDFLKVYVTGTNDDLSIMSIHFYDGTFNPYIDYGFDKNYFLIKIASKVYGAGSTFTGKAINSTVDKIIAKGFKNGIPKILIVMTDGASADIVLAAANRARANGIICLAVGIGPSINDAQLLQIAETSSNVIKISSYADLPKLVQFISNYFCKQILTIKLNETFQGNFVRVPQSPSYFRVIKSPQSQGRIYELDISFETDPVASNHSVNQSQIDPFPDEFTEYGESQYYEVYSQTALKASVGATFYPRKVYFIKPSANISYLVKKNIVSTMQTISSYVSIRGVNLGFNVSLKVCQTLKCQAEIAYYKGQIEKGKIIIIPQDEDPSIFIVIGATLAVLMCLCVLFILGLRRCDEEEEKKKRNELNQTQKDPLHETIPTNLQIQQTLVPASTNHKIKSTTRQPPQPHKASPSQHTQKKNSNSINSDQK